MKRPEGIPVRDDFEIVTESVSHLQSGEILLKTLFISVDPYLRGKMSGTKLPRFEINEPVSSKLIAEVVDSLNPEFNKGDFVSHYLDWKEIQISDGKGLVKLDPRTAPLSTFLGVLGVTGLSAYFALNDFGKPKKGETIVVSAAAGAVGSIAGQIGKLMGCRVIGIVGTDEKANLINDRFGFDGAINYNAVADLPSEIATLCPAGVDIYFDNVGGNISDAVIANINSYGRIIACGAISNYNYASIPIGPSLLPLVVYKFLSIHGFLIADFAPRFPEGVKQLAAWINSEDLHYSETTTKGFEKLPEAFIGLFQGENSGKMIVQV
jgi:NADPH-dependent curcumin reductase CurA